MLFFFYVYVCSFPIYQSYAVDYRIGRTFHYPRMCQAEGNKNCSFQFPVSHKSNCVIYETKVCAEYDFSTWNLEPFSKPASESESEFIVSVIPYPAYVNELQKAGDPVSAINVSLTSLNKDISGFSIVMTSVDEAKNLCRIFDFRESLGTFNIPFSLFYDCFNYLTEDHWENVRMAFRAYPLNAELNYLVQIPPKPKQNSTSACDWIPLVMIFRESLLNYYIQLKFSNAPKELDVSFFHLILWDSYGEEVRRSRIPAISKEDMLSEKFMVVKGGFYSVSIGINSTEESCTVFKSNDFLVGHAHKDYTLITFIILVVIMIISGSALLFFSCRWYLKSAASATKPTVLFVYHYKHLHHEFLVMYGKYLENYYGVKVNTLYERSGDPKAWLDKNYLESHVIIFVISEGLFHTFEQNISYEEHHWVDQLGEARALINYSKIGEKKICKICFSYSGKHHVPKCIEHLGPFFMLPNDIDEFLCFINNCSKKIYWLNKLCCQKHHKTQDSNLEHKDYEKINEKLSDLLENKFDALPVIDFKNVPKSNIQDEYKNQTNTFDQKCNFVSTNDSVNKCKVESVRLPKRESLPKEGTQSQTSDSEDDENDDYFLYCVRKMLNSQ